MRLRRYNRWASKMPHIHFYLWEPVADWLGIEMLPVPCPYVVDRFIGPNGLWRFSFDS
jgi:hypothetical protein